VIAQLALPPVASASHLGSSTASAGSAPPPAVTAIESFQPDLFTGRATTALPIALPPGRKGQTLARAATQGRPYDHPISPFVGGPPMRAPSCGQTQNSKAHLR